MFNHSKSLLFRPMPALNKLKIYQSLPLSPRESKQLLNLLTKSFRQQLDTEHGEFKTETGPKSAVRASTHHASQRPRKQSFSEPWNNPTDRHMHSMLTNPLFNYAPDRKILHLGRDPMDLFDSAVAKGMMNLDYARVVLQATKREIVQSSVPNIRDGMRDSKAGLKVLKWLISSGQTNDLEFLKDEAFAGILMQYMVAEGLQEAAWAWIKKSFERLSTLSGLHTSGQGKKWYQTRRDIVRPLMFLVRAEANAPGGLNNAYICLSRAAGYPKGFSTVEMRHVLGPPGLFLAHQTVMSDSRYPPPSESSFESFLSLVPIISRNIDYYFAHLTLIHPTKPSADLALTFLRSLELKEPQGTKQAQKPFVVIQQEQNHIQLGLDTAKYLLENDRYDEAEWVMDLLRKNFPDRLGVQQRRQLEQAKAEASSLELLESEGLILA